MPACWRMRLSCCWAASCSEGRLGQGTAADSAAKLLPGVGAKLLARICRSVLPARQLCNSLSTASTQGVHVEAAGGHGSPSTLALQSQAKTAPCLFASSRSSVAAAAFIAYGCNLLLSASMLTPGGQGHGTEHRAQSTAVALICIAQADAFEAHQGGAPGCRAAGAGPACRPPALSPARWRTPRWRESGCPLASAGEPAGAGLG